MVSIGRRLAPENASDSSSLEAATATISPASAPRDGEQDALHQRFGHDPLARGAHRQPHGRLAAARDGAGQHQIRHVRAGDQQHQRAHRQQNPQASSVLLLHHAHAGAGRHDGDDLLRQHALDPGQPVGRVAGLVPHPLPQQAGEPRLHPVDGRARAEPADHAQPRRNRLAQERRLRPGDQRFLLQRHPHVGRIGPQRLAEKPWRRHAGHGEGLPLHDQRGSDDRRVSAVDTLPCVIRQNQHRAGRRHIVRRGEHATDRRVHAERREVVAADVDGAKRTRRVVYALPAHAHASHAGLKGRELLELRYFGLDSLEQREREHAPAVLRAALHAAVVAVADAVQPGGVAHRQRLQHHRMNEREDSRGAADPDGEREDGRGREGARRSELAERVAQVTQKSPHAGLRRGAGRIRCVGFAAQAEQAILSGWLARQPPSG